MDCAVGTEASRVLRYHSPILLRATRLAARLAQESEPADVVAHSASTLLAAAAAVESVALEAASVRAPDLYNKASYKRAGAADKLDQLAGSRDAGLEELWAARVALMHGEPDNERGKDVGVYLTAQRAVWCVEVMEAAVRTAWGSDMPEWMRKELPDDDSA